MRNKIISLILFFNIVSFNLFSNSDWDSISNVLLKKCIENEKNEKSLHYLANMAYFYAKSKGWNSKPTKDYLNKLFESIDKDGLGIGYEWDAFQDGTINSIKTNYTITITEHVGPIIIEGFKNKVISKKRLMQLLDAFKKVPLADTLGNGKCLSYSDSENDRIGCVHNVNISAAYFIERLEKVIKLDQKLVQLKKDIIKREINSYIHKDSSYYYWDGSNNICDQNHLSYQAWCMNKINDSLTQVISCEVIKKIENNFENNLQALIGQVRLVPLSHVIKKRVYNILYELFIEKEKRYKEMDGYYYDKPRTISELLFLLTRLKYEK
jgi:hypothetical protein